MGKTLPEMLNQSKIIDIYQMTNHSALKFLIQKGTKYYDFTYGVSKMGDWIEHFHRTNDKCCQHIVVGEDRLLTILRGSEILSIENSKFNNESMYDFIIKKGSQKIKFTLSGSNLGVYVTNLQEEVNGEFQFVAAQDMFEYWFEHSFIHGENFYGIRPCDSVINRTVGFSCDVCGMKTVISLSKIKQDPYNKFFQSVNDRKKMSMLLNDSYILSPHNLELTFKDIEFMKSLSYCFDYSQELYGDVNV
jgi:hypothetical protein